MSAAVAGAAFSEAALDGQRAATRLLSQLSETSAADRLFAKVCDLIDRRDPDDLQPKLRAFLGEVQRELIRRGAA